VKRVLGMKLSETTRADALALFRAREFDEFFPGVDMEPSIRRQVREMGSIPSGRPRAIRHGRARGKRSRAFCAPVRVPTRCISCCAARRADRLADLPARAGHALHFANMRPDHPMEYRWMGTTRSPKAMRCCSTT
jgi:hypothetical protein